MPCHVCCAVLCCEQISTDDEQGLTFIGLVGMHDPPRRECAAALETCRVGGGADCVGWVGCRVGRGVVVADGL